LFLALSSEPTEKLNTANAVSFLFVSAAMAMLAFLIFMLAEWQHALGVNNNLY